VKIRGLGKIRRTILKLTWRCWETPRKSIRNLKYWRYGYSSGVSLL